MTRFYPTSIAGRRSKRTRWPSASGESVADRERAHAEFRRRRDPAEAAEIALALSIQHRANLGNPAAGAGWLARAERLVNELGFDELRGWLALMRVSAAGEPGSSEEFAREAFDLARRSHDPDLELCALAQLGAALVGQGRIEEGLLALDEAMA